MPGAFDEAEAQAPFAAFLPAPRPKTMPRASVPTSPPLRPRTRFRPSRSAPREAAWRCPPWLDPSQIGLAVGKRVRGAGARHFFPISQSPLVSRTGASRGSSPSGGRPHPHLSLGPPRARFRTGGGMVLIDFVEAGLEEDRAT